MNRLFNRRTIKGAGLAAGLALVFAGMFTAPASALSGADFNPARIIDDVVFTNNASMSVADVQNFLNAKVPNCDTNGTQASTHWNSSAGRYYTRAEWGNLNGNAPPYVCLRNYVENTTTKANNYRGAAVPGGISAAQIIWNAAQAYRINPQVLLVTLQKEQGIVTDDWPWAIQYTYAMGYACPDTGDCNATYRGFYNQVENAAWQFRYYLDHPNAFNYWIGSNNIKYNPSASCGSSIVNIQNAATAALYIYTPYQPNAGALAGMTDSTAGPTAHCGAYGNRNFFWYFNKWFGSTYAPSFAWQSIGQYAYTDETLTIGRNPNSFFPGDRVYVGFKARNTGNQTWTNSGANPINVGTVRGLDRSSAFFDPTWLGYNRPGRMVEASVAPGEIGTFQFWVKAPSTPGVYKEHFGLLSEGRAWMNDPGLNFVFTVNQPVHSWQFIGQYSYTDQNKTTSKPTTNMLPGDRVYVGFKARNTGNQTWTNSGPNPTNVGMTKPLDRWSPFYDASWLGPNRPTKMLEASVAPGQIGTFEFWMKAPANPGTYREHYSLVTEHKAWHNDPGLNFYMTVAPVTYSWQFIGQYAYTDQTKTTSKSTLGLARGERFYVGFKARNTGNITWKNNGSFPMSVGMTHPLDRLSPFFDGTWLGQNRPTRMVEASVAPGEIGTFEFWMKAPSSPGTYREYYSLVAEHAAWLNDPKMNFYTTVN